MPYLINFDIYERNAAGREKEWLSASTFEYDTIEEALHELNGQITEAIEEENNQEGEQP